MVNLSDRQIAEKYGIKKDLSPHELKMVGGDSSVDLELHFGERGKQINAQYAADIAEARKREQENIKIKEKFGGADIKKEQEERTKRLKAKTARGLSEGELLEEKSKMRSAMRSRRAALAGTGVRGKEAGQQLTETYQQGIGNIAAREAAQQMSDEELLSSSLRKQQLLRESLQIEYGGLRGGIQTGRELLNIASQPAPSPRQGLLGTIFGGLF